MAKPQQPQDKRDAKGKDQRKRGLGERLGSPETGPKLHPLSREAGIKGASNVGEDESSGSE
jgi:hypothetical protein